MHVRTDSSSRITTTGQLLDLLDGLFDERADSTSRAASEHWNRILRTDGHPLNTDLVDINLLDWHRRGLLRFPVGGTALDIGCGLGRNSRWLASHGLTVTAVDIADAALEAARQRTDGAGITFLELDFLRERVPAGPFDVVYDSGCFHHLAPHRRISYLESLRTALAPGGSFGICTFAAGRMGSAAPDDVLLRRGGLGEGVGYTNAELTKMFSWLELVEASPMPPAETVDEPAFTQDFLTVALFHRPHRRDST
ncbi:MAG TPA: class I SAM-dependent methyltransferase [Actinopolymorphaceae bacterium]